MSQHSFAQYLKFILFPSGEEFRYQNWCSGETLIYDGKPYIYLDVRIGAIASELSLGIGGVPLFIPLGDATARKWRDRFMESKGFGRSRLEVVNFFPSNPLAPTLPFLYRFKEAREDVQQGGIEVQLEPAFSASTAKVSSAIANQALIPELARVMPR